MEMLLMFETVLSSRLANYCTTRKNESLPFLPVTRLKIYQSTNVRWTDKYKAFIENKNIYSVRIFKRSINRLQIYQYQERRLNVNLKCLNRIHLNEICKWGDNQMGYDTFLNVMGQ